MSEPDGQSIAADPTLVAGPAARKFTYKRYAAAAVAAVLAGAIALIVADASAQASKPPPPLAKAFSLAEVGHPGTRVALAAYAGHPVVVNFFASWCAPCRSETPLLARYYSATTHGRVIVLGVDANDASAAALQFIRKAGVRYPVGSDPYPSRTTTSYGVYALPQTFFLNAAHRIVAHVVGPLTTQTLARDVALMDKERG